MQNCSGSANSVSEDIFRLDFFTVPVSEILLTFTLNYFNLKVAQQRKIVLRVIIIWQAYNNFSNISPESVAFIQQCYSIMVLLAIFIRLLTNKTSDCQTGNPVLTVKKPECRISVTVFEEIISCYMLCTLDHR